MSLASGLADSDTGYAGNPHGAGGAGQPACHELFEASRHRPNRGVLVTVAPPRRSKDGEGNFC